MSSCSSDSDDDLYTNTASIFKKITKKVNEESKVNQIDLTHNTVDPLNSTIEVIDVTTRKSKRISDSVSNSNKEVVTEITNTAVEEDKNVVNLDKSVDIIENINACLDRNKRGKGRRKNSVSPRKSLSRNAKKKGRKQKKSQVIASIEIDVDYPILNSGNFLNTSTNLGGEITVKVLWKSQCLERFEMRKKQKLDIIFKHYAEKEKVSEELLYFSINDTTVCKIDTPESLNLNAASIIEGGILSTKTHLSLGYKQDAIELKVQWKNLKKPLVINMRVTDDMKVLMEQCSKEMKIPIKKLKFYFDGEMINASDSPSSLELEGGECIDCTEI